MNLVLELMSKLTPMLIMWIVSRLEQPSNMKLMLVTLLTSNEGMLVRLEQPSNMKPISVTLLVLNKGTLVRLEQPLNM